MADVSFVRLQLSCGYNLFQMRFPFWISSVFITSLVFNTTFAQSSGELLLGLQKLNTLSSVLYIAAHPDDENTRLLPYLSKERKLRTGYLSLTRGDGGQNLVGKEQGDALGLIRTQELLAARRIDGAEQFFTRANDFGYSKNPEETFSIWNKDSILADVVLTIRRFRPDVIICRFPTTGEGGHGHHTASAILALEAFDAAADPKRFPWQLQEAPVWQAKRVFWNTFNFGGNNTTSEDQLKVDVGGYNALLGKGYGEIAAESRSMHKSQGFGSAKTRGSTIEYFKFLKGEKAETDLFQGVDLTWKRIPNAAKIQSAIDQTIKSFQPSQPALIAKSLASIYQQISELESKDGNSAYWKKQKLKEIQELLLAASGLWFEVTSLEYAAIPGQSALVQAQLVKRNTTTAKLLRIRYAKDLDSTLSLVLKTNELYTFKHSQSLPASLSFSNPYWLNEKHGTGSFVIEKQALIGKPENDPSVVVAFDIEIEGVALTVERGLVYKSTDPVKGEIYRPFEVLPPATVTISEKEFVFAEALPRPVQFTIKANAANAQGKLEVKVPEGWKIELTKSEFSLTNKGEETILEGILTPSEQAKDGDLHATLEMEGKRYDKSIRRIEYDHIPYQFMLSNAEAGLVRVNLKKAGTKIAYIPGAGDEVPGCLTQIGYDVTILNDALLTTENLSRYNAIVTGVRAYNTMASLQGHYAKLMEYVFNGGNLIVQYNTNNRIGPVLAKIGPYPFTISRDRVTDEKAEITFVDPKAPVLQFPNVITAADFEGWVQERGIYFATEHDKNYQTVFSMHDSGEKALEGSLIIAKHGKGNFVYTGLAFFRQLPAGVPGAYRLLVNLLSLPPNK